MSPHKQKFNEFLKRLSTKGFLDTIHFIKNNENCHYNEIAKFLMDKKIVSSRASVTTILNALLYLDLAERKVENTKPIRTTYKLTKTAAENLKYLKNMKNSFR